MTEAPKILAIQFKYFGDAVLMTPALRAMRGHFPESELHVLVPEEVAPLLQHLPWLNRVWPMPRRRGRVNLSQTWPVIRALRRKRFDRSVDFGGNDRGAISSLFIGARLRLGLDEGRGYLRRRLCYNQRVPTAPAGLHESARLAQVLSGWGITPSSLESEIRADPAMEASAEELLPAGTIVCHIAASQPKKEWPVAHWVVFYQMAAKAGCRLAFTTAKGAREQSLMEELKRSAPQAPILPVIPDLGLFLAVLKQAAVFVSGDTGPLHFAAALSVPTIGLFGPSSPAQWAPLGKR
ncbi:MAG TPA: glycosyltransferase family 9 protein, partial [Candidatus Nitrosopolaris sp.]|nr:glycosyltransferase family 9 protein [Candidatus Nitrosopolaris sp.]